ncbi:HAD-IIIC family phosphatase [Amycolatopsis mediterranei]|uniref:HAD-IIIC family phosphatase n=1 Tax=Amycolatopsis mediterranei TaxID=33910 RepID=UPI00341D325C
MRVPTIKCVIWDLDETLWAGTLAESDRVELSDDVRAVVTGLDERGILQSVCSRNDHDEAWRQLEQLGVAGYFVLPMIGWGPKSTAVSEIVERLGFAQNAVAFVDDQPAERAEVAHHLPGIRCYPADQATRLLGLPEFDPPRTATSARRRQLYQTEERRTAARAASTGTDADFLRSLRAELTIEPAGDHDLDRLAELTVRTTQLNTTGVPYAREELAALRARADHEVLVARLTDRFGDYGEVGIVLLARLSGVWRIRLLSTSCRVLAHGVGAVLLRWIIDRAHRAGVHLVADFRRTDRNRQMAVAYRFAGFDDAPCACRQHFTGVPDGRLLHLLPSPQPPPDTLRLTTPPSIP